MGAAVQQLPKEWFAPRPVVYWVDMLASAGLGWLALVMAATSRAGARGFWLTLSALALYRAALFIHEVAHLAPRDIPYFKTAWNVLVGVPVLLPSFLYEGVHLDRHRPQMYGTTGDPEYVPFASQSLLAIATFLIGSAVLPLVLVLRFGLIAPISWIVPTVRRAVLAHGSSLVINPLYVRRAPMTMGGRVQEVACAGLVWTVLTLWIGGVLPGATLAGWLAVLASASLVNAVRTLAAHRYTHDASEREFTTLEQLLDTCTLSGQHPLQMLGAPVGLRYHALHHWIPSLPYHNLPRAHRLLAASLPPGEPYHQTTIRSISGAIADLIAQVRKASSAPRG